jgi:hypothetical protein
MRSDLAPLRLQDYARAAPRSGDGTADAGYFADHRADAPRPSTKGAALGVKLAVRLWRRWISSGVRASPTPLLRFSGWRRGAGDPCATPVVCDTRREGA